MTPSARLIRSRGYRQEEEWQHSVSPAAALLCVDIIASSVGGSRDMSGKQQVHSLVTLNMLRVICLLNSLIMTSELKTHLHRQQLPLNARQASMRLENATHTDDTERHKHACCHMLLFVTSCDLYVVQHTSEVLDCSEPFSKHSRAIRQRAHAPQTDEADPM